MTQRREFIKQLGLGMSMIAFMPRTIDAFPFAGTALPRSMPEAEGVSSAGLIAFLDAIVKSKIEFHSLMVLRHGKVIAEGWWAPYAAPLKHTLYSLSKSFTSTAVGLAINEGKFKLDSKVISFFPEDLPETISPNLAAMTVKDLLTMSTGHGKDTIQPMRTNTNGESWAKIFLSLPIDYPPGTHFLYNTGSTYMQSAIVQKTTGKPVLEYLKPRLFDPLGIEGMDWEVDPKGINVGGYGLRVRTEDIAKFGQLYLQNGKWNGKQLIPADWIVQATSKQIDNAPANPTRPNEENDWAQGYGFQFWRCTHNAVRGDGAFGQFCVMMPAQDMVVAITSESFDLPRSLKLVWDYLLPAVQTGVKKDQAAQNDLSKKLKGLSISPPKQQNTSPLVATVFGKDFTFGDNSYKLKSVRFETAGGESTIAFTGESGTLSIRCKPDQWTTMKDFKTEGIFAIQGRQTVSTPLAASATWLNDKTFQLSLRYIETAHSDTFTFTFDGNELTLSFLNSVSKGNPSVADQRAPLAAKLTS
jgi:CubicO group peptidase (beta-lactamase class C family)